ncbi:MAG: protease HtpX [Ottowia sp.]|nr:protease HtpX [Ottowia sp.]
MQRIFLYVLTNLAVVTVLGVIASIFGVGRYMGTNTASLLVFSLVIGFGGSLISLFMSKSIAKMSMRVHVIDTPSSADEQWLVNTVRKLADTAGVRMPEVGVYQGAPNAFATGAFKNSALVAVSTGLLQGMNRAEVEAVLAHEMSHVSNGDMVTMALIQGVMNTFVVFLSRVIGSLVDGAMRRGNNGGGGGIGYWVTTMVLQVLFGFLAGMIVAWFSRWREFRADAGSAALLGDPAPMIAALRRLGGVPATANDMPQNLQVLGIAGGVQSLFASHPPLEQRIAALQAHGK